MSVHQSERALRPRPDCAGREIAQVNTDLARPGGPRKRSGRSPCDHARLPATMRGRRHRLGHWRSSSRRDGRTSSEAALWRSALPVPAGSATRAGLAGIAVRPMHGLAAGALVPPILLAPARLVSASSREMPPAATAVQLYGEGDCGEEMHLEWLAQLEPATGPGEPGGFSAANYPAPNQSHDDLPRIE